MAPSPLSSSPQPPPPASSHLSRRHNNRSLLAARFTLNGLAHANRIFGREEFRLEDWKAEGEYVYDNQGGRHQAFVSAIRDTTALGAVIKQGQRVQIEQSIKYSKIGCDNLWRAAGLRRSATWNGQQNYGALVLDLFPSAQNQINGPSPLFSFRSIPPWS